MSGAPELRWELVTGEAMTVGDTLIRPQSRVLSMRLPWAALALNHPVAVLVERDGEVERVPILDPTRIAQGGLLLLALLAAVLLNVVAWAELYGFGWIGAGTLADLSLYHQPCYILAICIVFTLSILVTVYVASSISSSLRQREAQLEQTYRQLAALDEEKSFFMRKVSHELRSPLAAIRSCLSVALDDLPTGTDSHAVELISRAERRSRSLLDMVTDLLKFSRMREGVPLTYDREPVNLAHLAESVIESFAERAREKDITLTRDIKPVRLAGSEDALQELLANLIGNAIKYTPSGGSVTVSTCPDGDSVVLVVSDSGIGIEPEALGGIFEEFSRTERGRTYDPTGTGMGLAIVKRVVDLHGGTIHLESEPDKGSTVTVRLPVERVREDVS